MTYHKVTVEAEELKEKMDRMRAVFIKSQGIDDYIFSMGGIASKPIIQFPSKFAIPETDKFTSNGDLK